MPEIRALTGAVRQFQAAAQLMTTQLTRMTIEAYGAAAGLGMANAALAGFSQQLFVVNETLAGVGKTAASTQKSFASLDRAMSSMQGPAALQGSLAALNREAEFVRGGIDTLLNPALGDLLPVMGSVYEAIGVLASASVRFGNTMVEILNRLARAAAGALVGLNQATNGLRGSGSGGAETPNFNNAWENFLENKNVDRIVGGIPFGGIGHGVVGGITELIRAPERARQIRGWNENQIINNMPRVAAGLGATETRNELQGARNIMPALERRLADMQRQAQSERGRTEDYYDPMGAKSTITRPDPTPETQRLLNEAQWAVRANNAWITSLSTHQQTLTAQNQENEATISRLTGSAGAITAGGTASEWGSREERAAFVRRSPDTSLRQESVDARNLIRDYQYRSEHGQDTSVVFRELRRTAEEMRAKLDGTAISGTQRSTYGEVVSAIERAVPTLDPANQVVDTRPAVPVNEIKDLLAGVKASLAAVPMAPPMPPKPTVMQAVGQRLQGAWTDAKAIGKQQVASAGQGFTGLLASFTPLGAVATLLQGVFQGLAPLIDAVKEPLRIVGEIFGKALAPILKAIFPIFKLVAIAATWVGQIFFSITGAILTAIGTLVRGIGRLVNKLPGSPGDPLVRAGQAMIDLGRGFNEGAQALKEGREEISKLEFGETASTVAEANEQLRNVPEGFKVALARFTASAPVPATGGGPVAATIPAPPPPPAVVENSPVTIHSVQIVSNDPERIWRELQPVMERDSYRHSGSMVAAA